MTPQKEPWTQNIGDSPVLAIALHHGTELRSEVHSLLKIDDQDRLREEDPFTGAWTDIVPTSIVVNNSRFEVDLNRPRHRAVYRTPDDAWGMDLWREELSETLVDASLNEWDLFYSELRTILAAIERTHTRFVILDFHSYNHRRGGARAAHANPEENPQINIGTGTMNRKLWAPVVDAFSDALRQSTVNGEPLDVRENVKFKGGYLATWVHENFPESGCVISIEVKKFFMDEWTGKLNRKLHEELHGVFRRAVEPLMESLKKVKNKKKINNYSPTVNRPIRIGFVVNDVNTEEPGYTTIRLAMAAQRMGHTSYMISVGDLAYDSDEKIKAHAVCAPRHVYKNGVNYLRDIRSKSAIRDRVSVDELDVLMLRNDPAQDAVNRPWASQAGILFGRVALRSGVIVLNDPNGLAKATSKMYFQTFPAEIRPETIITRNRADLKAFAKERGTVVLKPLTGSGGQSVFLVRPNDLPNMNQMIDSVSRDGFVIAQEYLPQAENGDTRLFVMNGEAFCYKGKYAAFRRVRKGGDMRSNLHAGGGLARARLDHQAMELVEMVRPKLIQDGMFLVGLDIVGNKLMEINVFSPGGLGSAQKFEGVNFAEGVIKALERKTQSMSYYNRQFDNLSMAIV